MGLLVDSLKKEIKEEYNWLLDIQPRVQIITVFATTKVSPTHALFVEI